MPGVLGLMIGLLVIQIIVVAVWGMEPAGRGLEDLERGAGGTSVRSPVRV